MEVYSKEKFLEGQILLIDKPYEWSSFQALNKVKWAIRKRFELNKKFKIGHAGTLDPLATGLLIICTGKFTKKIPEFQELTKEYTGTIRLGATTPSYDLETSVDATFPTNHITKNSIKDTAQAFTGVIEQVPPIFSAVKKDGKRAYEYARSGAPIELKTRKVTIFKFEITGSTGDDVHFRICCSKGTYIRSLANDFGKALGSGAHLTALRRTKIGDFHVDTSVSPESFKKQLQVS